MEVVSGLTYPSATETTPEVITDESHTVDRVIEGTVYACGAFLVLLRWRRVLGAARTVWPLVGLASLAPLSILWSVQPSLTLRRSTILLIWVVLAIYIGERFTMEKFARLLTQTLCLAMLLVIVLAFIAPTYVIDYSNHLGALKGLSVHKNLFGEYMAVAVMLLLLIRFRHFDWLRYLFLAAAVALLLLSRSATSLFVCVLVVAGMPLWHWARLKRSQRLLVCLITLLIVPLAIYFIAGNADLLIRVLGRDATLTGRTEIWAKVWPFFEKHPVLGYGYDAFWTGLKGESASVVIQSGWMVPHAHNGFLDLGLSLGAVGLGVFLGVWVYSLLKGIRFIRLQSAPIGLWPVSFLVFFILHNISESTLLTVLTKDTLPFLVFATITTSLAVNRRREVIASKASNRQRIAAGEWYCAGASAFRG
jgi:O-antigen ligase